MAFLGVEFFFCFCRYEGGGGGVLWALLQVDDHVLALKSGTRMWAASLENSSVGSDPIGFSVFYPLVASVRVATPGSGTPQFAVSIVGCGCVQMR